MNTGDFVRLEDLDYNREGQFGKPYKIVDIEGFGDSFVYFDNGKKIIDSTHDFESITKDQVIQRLNISYNFPDNQDTVIINFVGGPGSGKSTAAAYLFSILKYARVSCELVTEYAKDKTWEESFKVLDNQVYVFSNQYHKLNRLLGKVKFIITDSPIILSLIYDKEDNKELQNLVMSSYNKMNNLTFLIQRQGDYIAEGRSQTEEEARLIDADILDKLSKNNIDFSFIGSSPISIQELAKDLIGAVSKWE